MWLKQLENKTVTVWMQKTNLAQNTPRLEGQCIFKILCKVFNVYSGTRIRLLPVEGAIQNIGPSGHGMRQRLGRLYSQVTILKQIVNGVEDIDFHSVGCDKLFVSHGPHIIFSLLFRCWGKQLSGHHNSLTCAAHLVVKVRSESIPLSATTAPFLPQLPSQTEDRPKQSLREQDPSFSASRSWCCNCKTRCKIPQQNKPCNTTALKRESWEVLQWPYNGPKTS